MISQSIPVQSDPIVGIKSTFSQTVPSVVSSSVIKASLV